MYLETATRIRTGLQISRVVCDSGSGETVGDYNPNNMIGC